MTNYTLVLTQTASELLINVDLFLAKFLPVFVYPIGLACGLIALALVAQLFRWRRLALASTILGLLVIWVSSTPVFARLVYAQLEDQYPPIAIENLRRADVAILLGGSVKPQRPPHLAPDLNESVDRVWHAAKLFKAGKVDRILITGGNSPWKEVSKPEADLTADILVSFGVPRSALLIENKSRNTFENAHFSRPIWEGVGFETGYLVTSAAHMPRALAVFKKAGYSVEAAATDYQVSYPIAESVLDWLPSHEGLVLTTNAMKEVIGTLVYRWRGWI